MIENLLKFINKNFWKIIIILFLVTRLVALVKFGLHNDEMIYTQFAQAISDDWQQNWSISLDGRQFGDYKDPLQYWFTAWTVNLFNDPTSGVRLFSLVFSLFGFYCFTQFIRKVIGELEARIVAVLWVVSGYYFYFDILGIAEVYIYSLSACLLYGVYKLSLINNWKEKGSMNFLTIIVIMLLALLTKQSAIVILPILVLVPWLFKNLITKRKWLLSSLLLGCFFMAKIAYDLLIGNKFAAVREKGFALLANTYSMKELLAFPMHSWLKNIKFYLIQTLTNDWLMYIGIVIILGVLAFNLWQKKGLEWIKRYGVILLIWLASFLPAVLTLRGNTVRHYGMFLFVFYLLIGLSVADLLKLVKGHLRQLIIGSLIILTALQLIMTMVDVCGHETTAMANLEIGDIWASPIGVRQLISKIKTLPEGVLLYDRQWGNPGTAIQVYSMQYPKLMLYPLGTDVDELKAFYYLLAKDGKKLYIAFDLWTEEKRPWAKKLLDDNFICGKKEVIHKSYKQHIYKNTTLVLCEVGGNAKK